MASLTISLPDDLAAEIAGREPLLPKILELDFASSRRAGKPALTVQVKFLSCWQRPRALTKY